MRRIGLFFLGSVVGGVLGAVLSLIMTPASGDQMRDEARHRFDGLMDEARYAAETRRMELEHQLADLTSVQR